MATLGLEWMMVILIPVAAMGYILLAYYVMNVRKNVPEAEVYSKARKHKLPMIRITDTSGREELALGVKEKKGDISFDSKKAEPYGIYLDPRILGTAPETRTKDGVQIFHYSTDLSLPIGSKNARGILGIVKYVRENYPFLDFLDDLELIDLIGTSHDDLPDDVQNYIDQYEPKYSISENPGEMHDMDQKELVKIIEQIQDETNTLPIETGFFSYAAAFKLIPTAMLPQDINQLIMWVYRKARKDIKFDIERLMMYAMAIVMVLAGVGVTIYILSMVK